RAAARASLPLVEQFRITFRTVLVTRNRKRFCDAIYPARRTFDFTEVADGSLVEHHVARTVGPFAAEFLIPERRSESDGCEDSLHLAPIADIHLSLLADFVAADFAFG